MANMTVKAFEQERKKEYGGRAGHRLRNTKLLLRNYHMLKEHAQNSVFGRTQMGESAFDILESMMSMYDNEVIIESIKRSATRTDSVPYRDHVRPVCILLRKGTEPGH